MSEPLEALYFNWLCAKVVVTDKSTPSLTHWKLLRTLYQIEFVWQIMGDDNRAEDGKELRYYFTLAAEIPDDPQWRILPGCSLLEMLIAFAKRAEFQTDDPAREWFWEFIDNLGLSEFTDGYDFTEEDVEEIVEPFIWRTYDSSGYGGLFPMHNPRADQRRVELWYQFFQYLEDRGRVA
jgi:hypothetical protein